MGVQFKYSSERLSKDILIAAIPLAGLPSTCKWRVAVYRLGFSFGGFETKPCDVVKQHGADYPQEINAN